MNTRFKFTFQKCFCISFSGVPTSGGTQVKNTDIVTQTSDHTIFAQWKIRNQAPTRASISVNSKTTISITFSITGTDPNGDMLTYDVYVGNNKKGSVIGASGANVTYTAGGLTKYTDYEYYVIAKDPLEESIQSSKATVRTYCPGNVSCSNGKYCDDFKAKYVDCTYCNGTGDGTCEGTLEVLHTDTERCPECDPAFNSWSVTVTLYECLRCGKRGEVRACGNCGYTSGSINHECQYCSGFGWTSREYISACSHGYYGHYYCDTHGNNVDGYTHQVSTCPHRRTSQHDN